MTKKGFPTIPKPLESERAVEIRPCKGIWNRYEGRVVLRHWWGNERPSEHHLHPVNPGGPRTYTWARSRSYARLRNRLLRWCDKQDQETARKRAVGKIPA